MSKTLTVSALLACAVVATAQGWLPNMPGFERYRTVPNQLRGAAKVLRVETTWNGDGKSFFYTLDGKRMKFDITKGKAEESSETPTTAPSTPGRGQGFGRGRQQSDSASPDKNWKVYPNGGNLWVSKPDGTEPMALTKDGSQASRISYADVPWVYNEELFQRTSMWWAPDSKRIAFYRFDESKVPDFYLTTQAAGYTNGLRVEPYPKAGAENPVVEVWIATIPEGKLVKIDTRSGLSHNNSDIGHYVYQVEWSPDGSELLFLRTNRRQNHLEWCAANPITGAVRIIATEKNPNGWTDISPSRQFLSDGKRFLWMSESTGYRNIYFGNLSGGALKQITNQRGEVESIVKVDEAKQTIWYTARTGLNPHMLQLHRVKFDGKDDRRLTDPKFSHRTSISPTGDHIVDIAESVTDAPESSLLDANGKVLAVLAKSDLAAFEKMGGQRVERLEFKAADGLTQLYGTIHKPSNFDPNKRYPVIVEVYNGPQSAAHNENFQLPDTTTELGFIVATFESRGGDNRGQAFKNAAYLKLGTTEIDDLAAGVRALGAKSYVDNTRVGVTGTSYGGYSSIMCLLRYPDLFHAAVASSSVTDWRHYDSIYTERYMWIPQENQTGYDAGSAMTFAKDLKGALLLYYGTLDDNVHPANTMALIRALQRERKSFEVQVTPDAGHSGVNQQRGLEFFVAHLQHRPAWIGK